MSLRVRLAAPPAAAWRRGALLAAVGAMGGAVLLFSQEYLSCFPPPKRVALGGLTLAGWAFAAAGGVRFPRGAPFTLPLFACLAWATLAWMRSGSAESAALGWLPLAAAAGLAWLVAALAREARAREKLVTAFVLVHLGCGLYGLLQTLGLERSWWELVRASPAGWAGLAEFTPWSLDYGPGRIFSTLGNPNFLAGHLVLALPVLVAAGVTGSPLRRRLAQATLAACALSFIYAQTRGAWLGLGAGVAFTVVRLARTRPGALTGPPARWLFGGALVLLAAHAVPALNPAGVSLPAQLASVTDLRQASARQRFFWWSASVELVKAAPVTGVGMKNFAREFPARAHRVGGPYLDLPPAFCDHPHNDYLYALCEYGVVGLGLVTWLALTWIRCLLAGPSRRDPLAIATVAGLIALGVHAAWNMPSVIQGTLAAAAFLLGLGVRSAEPAAGPPGGRAGVAAILAAAFLLLARAGTLMAGEAYLNGARIMRDEGRYPQAAYLARRTLALTRAPWRTSFMLGGILYSQQFYGAALDAFREDERENPWSADAILHQAKALRQLDRYEEAASACRRALKLVPNYTRAAVTLASLEYFRAVEARGEGRDLDRRRRLAKSRAWLTYALRFAPDHAEALKLLGYVEVLDRRWTAARDAWRRSLDARPDDALRRKLDALELDLPRLIGENRSP